jgi:hypothetical protein
MSNNFANGDSIDDFQELLDGLPQLTPIARGKRGGGRKATNNIGADVLGVKTLDDLRNNHNVDLVRDGIKVKFLYGLIDQPSYSRAVQIDRGIATSYPQVGAMGFSIEQSTSGEIFLQLWKGTTVNGVLSYQKTYSKSKDYRYGANKEGAVSFWRTNDKGEMYNFQELGTIVVFEDYLNAIVTETELPVSFPEAEVSNLQGLAEILANVNVNTVVPVVMDSTMTLDSEEDEVEDDEEEEDEVGA